MKETKRKYTEWCKKIASSKSEEELITHFIEHVRIHYERHQRSGPIGLKIWMIGVFNFMNILKIKFHDITTDDMLFKLCTYHRKHTDDPKPLFDVDEFLSSYRGEIKDFHKQAV